jgi:hypothetical protein
MKIADIREETKPITSDIRNTHIDFSKMTLSLVAVVTDVVREGRPVVVCGFTSNGRCGRGAEANGWSPARCIPHGGHRCRSRSPLSGAYPPVEACSS